MTILNDIRYIAVRITCSSATGGEKQGSGTIIKDCGRYFVMTAAHCVKGNDKQRYQRNDIRISIILGKDNEIELDVDDVVEFEEEDKKDWALIEIKKPKVDFQYERVRRCYNAADNSMELFFYYGFTEIEPAGALYRVENRSEAGGYWHLTDISIDGQVDTAHELIDGNSGAGVFFEHGKILYFVGYVKALVNQNGAYSDFIMYDYPCESKFLTEDSVKNITLDVLQDWIKQLSKTERELAKSKLGEEKPDFLANLERKMMVICSDEEDRERLTDSHINNYIEGNESMLTLLNKGNALYDELNLEDVTVVNDIKENRKEKFATEESAEQDLNQVREKYSKYAEAKFKYDNEQKTLAKKYTSYRVAEKLMDCTIDYKKNMREDVETVNKNPIMSKSTPLYRILSLLLIINFYKIKWGRKKWKGIDLRVIQIYIWGLSGSDNAESLARIGKKEGFPDIPFAYHASVMQMVSYCLVNGFLSIDKASEDAVYDLTPKAYVLLNSLKDDELRKEIDEMLEKIGVITKTDSKQLRIDWTDVAY